MTDKIQNDDKLFYSRLFWWAERYLSYRPRTLKEMRQYLLTKANKYRPENHCEQIVQTILDELITLNRIDDEAFVAWWVRERNYFKPRGEKLLRVELMQKGVNKELLDIYFSENPFDDKNSIVSLLAKKMHRLGGKKMLAYLLRKGFSYTSSKNAIEEYLANS